jgi:hypothetical protein
MATAQALIRSRLNEVEAIRSDRNHSEIYRLHRELKPLVDSYPFCDKDNMKSLLNQKFNVINHWHVDKEISKFSHVFGTLKAHGMESHYGKASEHLSKYSQANVEYRNSMRRLKSAMGEADPIGFSEAYSAFHDAQEKLLGFDAKYSEVVRGGMELVENVSHPYAIGVGLLSLLGIDGFDTSVLNDI